MLHMKSSVFMRFKLSVFVVHSVLMYEKLFKKAYSTETVTEKIPSGGGSMLSMLPKPISH